MTNTAHTQSAISRRGPKLGRKRQVPRLREATVWQPTRGVWRQLYKSGKYNVTEAAMAVGYSSLSHFSQSFCQTMGCCPGLYPNKAPAPKAALSWEA